MKRTQVTFILLIILFTLSACKPVSTVTPIALPSGCLIGRWPSTVFPLDLRISSEIKNDYTGADLVGGLNPLEQMAKVWNDPFPVEKALIKTTFGIAATTGYDSTEKFRDSEIGIYKSHTWFSNVSSNALGITQFFGIVATDPTLGTYIKLTHADIIMNYRDYGTHFTMKAYDVPTIVLHEMGHLLGLCHQITKDSIMAPYYDNVQRSLKTFDTAIIQDLYGTANRTNISAMTNTKPTNISAPIGTEISGIIELRSNGECIHKINGKEVFKHMTKLK